MSRHTSKVSGEIMLIYLTAWSGGAPSPAVELTYETTVCSKPGELQMSKRYAHVMGD